MTGGNKWRMDWGLIVARCRCLKVPLPPDYFYACNIYTAKYGMDKMPTWKTDRLAVCSIRPRWARYGEPCFDFVVWQVIKRGDDKGGMCIIIRFYAVEYIVVYLQICKKKSILSCIGIMIFYCFEIKHNKQLTRIIEKTQFITKE